MPSSASTLNRTLTNYARGFAQDKASALASFLAPEVATQQAHGQYKDFSDKNAFQVYDTNRAIGGAARRIEFAATDPYYNCRPQALEIAIDDYETDLAGQSDPLGMKQSKLETLLISAIASHENSVLTAVKAAVSAVGSRGNWSSDSVDPIKELDEQIAAITTVTGMMPNSLVLGLGAWNYLRNNAKVIARQPGSANIGLNLQQLSGMLLNPAIEIKIGVLSKDTAKAGATASKANIVGDEAFIFLRSDSPTTYDPSAVKTFRTQSGGVDAVYEYRDNGARSNVLAVDWTVDVKVVASTAIKRLSIS